MSIFENYARETADLERELERKGIALGIDWDNPVQLRLLARSALDCKPAELDCGLSDPEHAARFQLFGIAQLMLDVMRESAEDDILSHGGTAWKAFARALWAEHEARQQMLESTGD